MDSTQAMLEKVKLAKKSINTAGTKEKNLALEGMAKSLIQASQKILQANRQDLEAAKGQISEVMLDRLSLNQERIAQMAQGIRDLIVLPDPVGQVIEKRRLDNQLEITKKRVALGVVGIIYESRPNVTSDAAALALKSGNAVVLRSGKEAYQTSFAIVAALKAGLAQTSISSDCLQLVSDTSRDSAYQLMRAKGYLDLLIPRGGAGLIQAVVENAQVPVIETGTGICHVYVDKEANQEMALSIIENAKTSRPSVCNAMEVCLVHQDIAPFFLPKLKKVLLENRKAANLQPVRLLLDERAGTLISGEGASEADFDREFSDYILAVKVVSSLEEAVCHIEQHSTHHSDAIVTDNTVNAAYFTDQVDSAAVYINASTRFTDGGQFGLGCEMGISTQKLHARGPMGLEELTTYKYIVEGQGQIRE
ncbi:glutamate-5-semialdehyde dehydrogenase [Streptococcus massiliensis]|uniref:Gamma-glutamyl phosphate reductase n=1 Tax=Streptococcus massiliensis TaxID=313439 RepID=A0A380KUW0_9STRE|nr:glutamate-5-semialdehyde dehydrogenase [Streptococcus massiliensis]SUN75703.1 gamma-glutamyl phosphate reductase [Streptococcus massiliensis]